MSPPAPSPTSGLYELIAHLCFSLVDYRHGVWWQWDSPILIQSHTLHYKYHSVLLISVSVSLWKLCCGQRVVRHQTTASFNSSDMFVRPSVEDIKTSRAEMNDLGSLNWILEPGDEDQKSRGEEWEKGREKGLERLNKGEREGEACYFTAVWKIWLTWGCPTLQETASPGERERQTRAMAWEGGGWRGWMERIRGGGVNGVQGLCVRWCSVGVGLIFLLLQSR